MNTGTITKLLSTITQISKANKYRIFIDMPDIGDIDILCTESKMNGLLSTPVDVWYRGRKAQMRGESSFNQTWSITFYNNVNLQYRHKFIAWMRQIHHSRVNETGILEQAIPSGLLNSAKAAFGSITKAVNDVKNLIDDPGKTLSSLVGGNAPEYQGVAKIFQLDNNAEESYHQELVGLFPIEVSDVGFSDNNSELTSTTVTFAFSDVIYNNEEGGGSLAESIFGSTLSGNG